MSCLGYTCGGLVRGIREIFLLGRVFLAILGKVPRAFLIGKFSDGNPEFGKFSKHS